MAAEFFPVLSFCYCTIIKWSLQLARGRGEAAVPGANCPLRENSLLIRLVSPRFFVYSHKNVKNLLNLVLESKPPKVVLYKHRRANDKKCSLYSRNAGRLKR